MSVPLFLVCHATRQAVHVSELSSSWFRGADYSVLVGAFCNAHMGHEFVVMSDHGLDDLNRREDEKEYEIWEPDNFERLMRDMLGTSEGTEKLIVQIRSKVAE